MKHIFYFLAIFPILWEVTNIQDVKRTHNFILSFKTKDKKNLTAKHLTFIIFALSYFVWVFFGLLTFQWPVFLLFFAMSFVPKLNIFTRFVDSIISLIILIFIVLNAYHFKIDFTQFF